MSKATRAVKKVCIVNPISQVQKARNSIIKNQKHKSNVKEEKKKRVKKKIQLPNLNTMNEQKKNTHRRQEKQRLLLWR